MDKYFGLDISDKQTIACVIGQNRQESYASLPTEVTVLRRWHLAVRRIAASISRERRSRWSLRKDKTEWARHAALKRKGLRPRWRYKEPQFKCR